MAIVAVSKDVFSDGQEFAAALAERLRLGYVDAAVLVERAVAEGADRKNAKHEVTQGK